jgi:hypothetical protein
VADIFDDPWVDSDEEMLRSRRDHPAIWNGPPRYTHACQGCTRRMRSKTFLATPSFDPEGEARYCFRCLNDVERRHRDKEILEHRKAIGEYPKPAVLL